MVHTLSKTDTLLVDKKCGFQNLWNQIRGSKVSTPLTAYWLAQKTSTTKNLDKTKSKLTWTCNSFLCSVENSKLMFRLVMTDPGSTKKEEYSNVLSGLHCIFSLSLCLFSYFEVYFNRLKLSVDDIIVSQKGSNGDGKLGFYKRENSAMETTYCVLDP